MSKRFSAAFVLAVYSALLIDVIICKNLTIHWGHLIFKLGPGRPGPASFVPFRTIASQLRGESGWFFSIANLAGNTFLFMPVGFLAALLVRRPTWPAALTLGVSVGLAMETMEVIFQVGRFDVDDVTLNALGVMVGYLLFRVWMRRAEMPSVLGTNLNEDRVMSCSVEKLRCSALVR